MKLEEHIKLKVAWYYPSSEEVFSNIIKIWVQSMVLQIPLEKTTGCRTRYFKSKTQVWRGLWPKYTVWFVRLIYYLLTSLLNNRLLLMRNVKEILLSTLEHNSEILLSGFHNSTICREAAVSKVFIFLPIVTIRNAEKCLIHIVWHNVYSNFVEFYYHSRGSAGLPWRLLFQTSWTWVTELWSF